MMQTGLRGIYLSPYRIWLEQRAFAANTQRVYFSRIKQFLAFLEYAGLAEKLLSDENGTHQAVGAYLEFLKNSENAAATHNANIDALTNFAQFLGIEQLKLRRRRSYSTQTRTLSLEEQERVLRAIEEQSLIRDRALALVLFYSGARLSDCANLSVQDVGVGATSIRLSGGARVNLHKSAVTALAAWLQERRRVRANSPESPLWLSQSGKRLSAAGIAFIIKRVGWRARLRISIETLRRTSLTRATDGFNEDEPPGLFGMKS